MASSAMLSRAMQATYQNLKRFRDDRSLVSIRREGCDDRAIQAFVLHFSGSLILVRYVYDFHVDGILLLRVSDVTDIDLTATDAFQKQLLIEEGDFARIDFGYRPPVHSYDAFLSTLPEGEIVILEDEASDETTFLIGTLVAVDEDEVSVRFFTGAARWEEEPSVIATNRITSCQTETNYIKYYSRHFSREAPRSVRER